MSDILSQIDKLESDIYDLNQLLNREFDQYINNALEEITRTSLSMFRKTSSEVDDCIRSKLRDI
jgi:hypothetical protein